MRASSISISRSLMRMMLLSNGAVLGLMTFGFCSYEFLTFRSASVEQLQTLSQAIASNSTAALAFANTEDAAGVLEAFRANSHIVAAALYDAQGQIFATFPAELPADALPVHPAAAGFRFGGDALIGVTPVIQGSRQLGTLFVKSDLGAIFSQARAYALLLVLVTA